MGDAELTLSARLIECFFAQRERGLTAAIRRKTLLHLLDTLGIAIAARSKSPIAKQLHEAIGQGGTLSPASYAFLASAHSHILDFDDVHDTARVHPTAVTFPAAMAVAALEKRTTMGDIVDAVALGNELACRLGMLWKPTGRGPGSDWFLTQLFGYFSASMAACLVLRLNAGQARSALGLAYMQAAGGKEAGVGAGGTARAIYPAFAAMGGVQAALLARSGIEGPPTALDGAAGFFQLYFGRGLDGDQLTQLLDPRISAWDDTQFKPWPCCRHAHPYIVAAQALRLASGQEGIGQAVVRVDRTAAKLCKPLAQRQRPQTLQDAKYSIPFVVAFALVHPQVDLQSLNDAALEDPAVLAMAQRIVIEETGEDQPGLPHASMTVTMLNGGAQKTFDAPFAAPQAEDVLKAKFLSCLDYAGWNSGDAGQLWTRASAEAGTDLIGLRQLMA